jgi:hypothetical protein
MEKLTPDQVKLVLRRAAELERKPVADDTLTPAQLEEIAKEVGISMPAVRQALAEVSATPVAPRTLADRVIGPREIAVEREIKLPAAIAKARVVEFMDKQVMQVRRDLGDRVIWEKARGLMAAARTFADLGLRSVVVPKRAEIETQINAISDGETHVRIIMRLPEQRAARARGAVISAAVGAAVAIGAIAGQVHPIGLEIGLAAGGGAFGAGMVARARERYRRTQERASDGLERFLDMLK